MQVNCFGVFVIDSNPFLSQDLKIIPASPIIGHVLLRPAQHSVEEFCNLVAGTHRHVRNITVPINVPHNVQRFLRSAAKRAYGPDDDCSGVDFIMRTIGHQKKKRSADAKGEVDADNSLGEDEDEDDMDEEESAEQVALASGMPSGPQDPATMSRPMLRATFGAAAEQIAECFFQQSSRIGAAADFLKRSDAVKVKTGETGEARHYRKGQVDPTVWLSAFQAALNTTPQILGDNEALVILTGGTPEACAAGIVAGYRNILYVTPEPKEIGMMTLPEDLSKINFSRH